MKPVLCLFLEDSRRRVQSRLKKQLQGDPAPSNLHVFTDWPRIGEGGIEQLERWMELYPDTRFIIIDTWKKVKPRGGGNKNSYDADYEAIEPLQRFASDAHVSVLILHHTRKAAADDVIDELNSSTGLTGAVDSIMVLKRERGQGKADGELHITGRDIEEQALGLRFDTEFCNWILMGEAQECRRSEIREQIIALLGNNELGMTPKEIAEALHLKGGTVRRRLSAMLDDGQLAKHKERYTLPTYG